MTNQIRNQVLNRYADLKFVPAEKKPDTSKNRKRSARRRTKTRVIL